MPVSHATVEPSLRRLVTRGVEMKSTQSLVDSSWPKAGGAAARWARFLIDFVMKSVSLMSLTW
jgi:hypothetical protein